MNQLFWSFAQIRDQLLQRASLLYTANRLPWIIIALGIVLRFAQYLFNRSLWLDESLLALNIINRSFSELLRPLDYHQGAPIGFSILERLAVQVFGSSEYALRFFPLLSGFISLFLFYGVAKQCIKPEAVPVALGLFAISDPLIYYSSEVKQYSSDVAIALLLFWATIRILANKMTAPRIALFGALGAIVIWFSHPSVFILAGVGASLPLLYLSRRDWAKIGSLSVAYSLWALSFVGCYFISLRSLSNDKVLLDYWAGAFMPFPPLDFSWFVDAFFGIFKNPAGLTLFGVGALTFIIGCISMLPKRKEKLFVLISPILPTLLASSFHKYPFKGRLLLFIVPSLLLFIAEGAQQIRDNITTRYDSAIVGITLTGLLFFHPFYFASYHLIKPRTKEEIKPAINYVREHRQNGDILYLYYASRYAFQYYSENYGFNSDDYIVGIESEDWGDYMNDLEELCGNKRVWILFSHIKQEKEKLFLAYLDSTGIRLDSFKSTGAAVYLYDLSDCLSKQVRPEMFRIQSSQQERTVYICTQKYVLTNSP